MRQTPEKKRSSGIASKAAAKHSSKSPIMKAEPASEYSKAKLKQAENVYHYTSKVGQVTPNPVRNSGAAVHNSI